MSALTEWPSGFWPLWRDGAERLAEVIERTEARHKVADLAQIDGAIQFATEVWDRRNGMPIPDFIYGDVIWHEIVEDVISHLGLDYDEVYEVAP